jgi:hypothetical protein
MNTGNLKMNLMIRTQRSNKFFRSTLRSLIPLFNKSMIWNKKMQNLKKNCKNQKSSYLIKPIPSTNILMFNFVKPAKL